MRQYFFLILSLITIGAGCQATTLQSPIAPIPTFSTATIVNTPPRPIATASVISTLSTATLSPTAITLPVTDLSEQGFLLIGDESSQRYLVIDLNTGAQPYGIRKSPGCDWALLPGVTTMVCKHASGQLYLEDVFSGEQQDLPVWNPEWLDWSSNGQFLVYSQEKSEAESIFSYNLSTGVTQTMAVNIDPSEREQWLEPPVLSADGQSLVVARQAEEGPSVFEIMEEALQLKQIGLDEPFATWDIAWSPVARQLVYGATDIEQEIGPRPNYLFLVNMETGEVQEEAQAPDSLFFWSESLVWSPTGKHIAVGVWDGAFTSKPQACIINIDTMGQTCLPARRSTNGHFLTWSPSGEHIAFVDLDGSLVISNPDGTEQTRLLGDIDTKKFLLFWR